MHLSYAVILTILGISSSQAKSPLERDGTIMKRSGPNYPTHYSFEGSQGPSSYAPDSYGNYRAEDPLHWSNRPEEYQEWSPEMYAEHLKSLEGSSRKGKKGARKMLDGRAPAPSDPSRGRMTASERGLQDAGLVFAGVGTAAVAGVWAKDIMDERKERKRREGEGQHSGVQLTEISQDEEHTLQKRSHPIESWQGNSFYQPPVVNLPEVYGHDTYQPPPMPGNAYHSEWSNEAMGQDYVGEEQSGEEAPSPRRRRSRHGKAQQSSRRSLRESRVAEEVPQYNTQGTFDGGLEVEGMAPTAAENGADWVYGNDIGLDASYSQPESTMHRASRYGMYASGAGIVATLTAKKLLDVKDAIEEHDRREQEAQDMLYGRPSRS